MLQESGRRAGATLADAFDADPNRSWTRTPQRKQCELTRLTEAARPALTLIRLLQDLIGSGSFKVTIGEAYDTLGLDALSTTPDQALSRFRDLIRSNHPDGKPSEEQARANETTRVIVEACTLLRTQGFPRLMARNGAPRYERSAAIEPQSADPPAWLDEVWRDCVRSNLVCFVSPAFGIRLALDTWTTVCGITWDNLSKFND